ncbi:MAG: FtsQ-type POTRA domain-containing protein [Nocardioidaceae bacterium]
MARLRRRSPEERTRRRFARRQWARRWGVWRWVAAGVLLVALLVTGVWLVLFSSVLAVQGVTVTGTGYLKAGEIEQAAKVPTGEPLARVDLDVIRTRVEALAPVQSADVTRAWPDRVLIHVTEREAVAVVDVAGSLRGMDGDGVLFRTYPARPRGLPAVQIPTDADAGTRREVAGVLAALPADLLHDVDHLEADTVDQIRLVLRDGRVVVWGSADQSDEKATVLATLLTFDAQQYDVSVPGRPTTRP